MGRWRRPAKYWPHYPPSAVWSLKYAAARLCLVAWKGCLTLFVYLEAHVSFLFFCFSSIFFLKSSLMGKRIYVHPTDIHTYKPHCTSIQAYKPLLYKLTSHGCTRVQTTTVQVYKPRLYKCTSHGCTRVQVTALLKTPKQNFISFNRPAWSWYIWGGLMKCIFFLYVLFLIVCKKMWLPFNIWRK